VGQLYSYFREQVGRDDILGRVLVEYRTHHKQRQPQNGLNAICLSILLVWTSVISNGMRFSSVTTVQLTLGADRTVVYNDM